MEKYGKLKLQFNEKTIEVRVYNPVLGKLGEQLNEFYTAGSSVVNAAYFNRSRWVENVCRYKITRNKLSDFDLSENQSVEFCENSAFSENRIDLDDRSSSVAILLESPHRYEYNERYQPIAPAQGRTGEAIRNHVLTIINNKYRELLTENEYRVLIINPIPIQASLFFLHGQPLKNSYKTLRDNVWIGLWKNIPEFKTSLINIINSSNVKLLLNCCTSKLKYKLQIEGQINCVIKQINHPSSWIWGIKETV